MRLLLAEDNERLSRSLSFVLTSEGHTVDAVFDGKAALDFINAGSYDGLILDIMMPEISGMEVLRQVRAAGNTAPALILTALSDVSSRVEGLDAGADDYLVKPFAMEELLARVRAMLRRRESFQPPLVEYAGVSLNPSTRLLSYGGEAVLLSGKEYQVMECFLSNPGSIFSIDNLLSYAWNWDSDVDSSAVWIQVSNLRKRIKTINAPLEITFKRGSGYTLNQK